MDALTISTVSSEILGESRLIFEELLKIDLNELF